MQEFYIPNLLSVYYVPGKVFHVLIHLILTTSQRESSTIPILYMNKQREGCGRARHECPSHPLPWVTLSFKMSQKIFQSGYSQDCPYCVIKLSAQELGHPFQFITNSWHRHLGWSIFITYVPWWNPACSSLSFTFLPTPLSPSLSSWSFLKISLDGNSLAVQWLGLCASAAVARVQSLVGELRPPQTWRGQKRKIKKKIVLNISLEKSEAPLTEKPPCIRNLPTLTVLLL